MSDLGRNIKNIRTQHNLTQKAFADMLCVTQQAVEKWEQGASIPQFDRLQDISDKLCIPIEATLYDNKDISYKIPIDITVDVKSQIDSLKNKNDNLTYAESINLKMLEMGLNLKGGKWIIYFDCTKYEYKIYMAIRYIFPDYSADKFLEIIQRTRANNVDNVNYNY